MKLSTRARKIAQTGAAGSRKYTPSLKPARSNSGSAMVGVVVATLFLGIVAAAMVKTTGSQSSASRSHGSLIVASSTLGSGAIATQGYFAATANQPAAIAKMEAFLTNPDPANGPFVIGTQNAKQELANGTGQFYSSQLIDLVKNGSTVNYAAFDVRSGKAAGGREIGRATNFYDVGNAKTGTPGGSGAKNAVFSQGGVSDANNGMDVHGGVTILGDAKFQNRNTIFRRDAFFGRNVNFQQPVTFNNKVYINGNMVAQNFNASTPVQMFNDSVGIRGHLGGSLGTSTATLNFARDFWLGGNIGEVNGAQFNKSNIELRGNLSNNFNYTNNLPVAVAGKNCSNNNNSFCTLHNIRPSDHLAANSFRNFAAPNPNGRNVGTLDSATIINALKIGHASERRDPELDISKVDNATNVVPRTLTSTELTVANIHKAYDDAKKAGQLYNGTHLVVKLNSQISLPTPAGTARLDSNVIFILENGSKLGGQFFRTKEGTSTLIYARGNGANGHFDQFDVAGTFHGYIYIARNNTPPGSAENTFNISSGSEIKGALHSFAERPFRWNTSGSASATPPVIRFDEDVLKNFSTMSTNPSAPPGGAGDNNVSYINQSDQRIYLTTKGVYYHY